MDSLQRQMEEHTVTVHESMSSWTQIEGQLTDLTTNLSVTLLANENLPHRDLQDQQPSTDIKEELTQWSPKPTDFHQNCFKYDCFLKKKSIYQNPIYILFLNILESLIYGSF